MGSPPRMRGKAVAIFRQLHHGRITPAYAGKRDSIPQQSSLRRDHPRVCGEKPRIFFMSIRSAGSPPRMRGKGQPLYIVVSESGITPACAGKRKATPAENSVLEDHPRVCGEKCALALHCLPPQGSPPRVRGKGWIVAVAVACFGITPACAGKSSTRPLISLFSGGSPPRVRGKEKGSDEYKVGDRITPACAGKRRHGRRYKSKRRDHPRVCGEKLFVFLFENVSQGSPPRVRGKDIPMVGVVGIPGITPACAGKSQ